MKLINQKFISVGEYLPRFASATPFLIEGCMILQCIKGCASFRLDFKDFNISEGDIVFLFNDMVIELGTHSNDFTIRYVSVPGSHIVEIYVNITSTKFWDTLYLSPVQRFNETYKASIDRWINECIFVANNSRKPVSDIVISKLLISLFMVMEDVISQNTVEVEPQFNFSPWKIMGDFYVLLSRHYTAEHKVSFYADALNITPDYLSVVAKECTGLTPKETIDRKLVLAIKALLESTTLPIKNIAERLYYEDTSHLCKVFRRHAGMSPMEYRRSRQK